MNWIPFTDMKQIDELLLLSSQVPVAIYKHSTRCSISSMVKKSLELDWNLNNEQVKPYYLDLISYRNISNEIAGRLQVRHESPQLILLKDGKVVYDASHSEIDFADMSAKR